MVQKHDEHYTMNIWSLLAIISDFVQTFPMQMCCEIVMDFV